MYQHREEKTQGTETISECFVEW